jgi:hypothetical protein
MLCCAGGISGGNGSGMSPPIKFEERAPAALLGDSGKQSVVIASRSSAARATCLGGNVAQLRRASSLLRELTVRTHAGLI